MVVVALLVAAVTSRDGDDEPGSSSGGTQVETAQQILQDRCDIAGDGSLTHLSTSPGDDDLTEISFTTSEDFVGTVYVNEDSEFLDEVDCPGSDENAIVVPPEWEGVGDPVEYLVASECGFGPETKEQLSLISISDAAPGERPTWEIGLPDGTVGRLLPDGEIECPAGSTAEGDAAPGATEPDAPTTAGALTEGTPEGLPAAFETFGFPLPTPATVVDTSGSVLVLQIPSSQDFWDSTEEFMRTVPAERGWTIENEEPSMGSTFGPHLTFLSDTGDQVSVDWYSDRDFITIAISTAP